MDKPSIYIVSDGKPGHLAQSKGLAEAIGRQVDTETHEIDAFTKYSIANHAEPKFGVLLCAGRGTISPGIFHARRLGVPAVALMNPGWLKRNKFELCVIPRHDGIPESDNVILTEGALNGMTPASDASSDEALLLIGGPSKHHHWEDESLLAQLHSLLGRDKSLRWTATGSRRTPEHTDRLLRELADEHGERFDYTPASDTPRGWVAEQLKRCGLSWVSEDSVSMVYESLTAGARVGLIDVPRRKPHKPGRVVRGVESLVERGWVKTFDQWYAGEALPDDRPPLAEADRVASIIIDRWLKAPPNA